MDAHTSPDIIHSVSAGSFLTDHAAVHCKVKFEKPPLPRREITYMKTKNIVHEDLGKDIRDSALFQAPASSLDDLVSQYNCVLVNLLEKHAPLKKATITIHPSAPWYNDSIRDAKRICRHHERIWRRTRCPADRLRFQAARKSVNGLINSSRSEHYAARISKCTDQKALFSVIDELLHHKTTRKLPAHSNKKDLCEQFCGFFSSKISGIREKLDRMEGSWTGSETGPNARLDNFEPTNEHEILKIVNSSPTKSSALDPIPTAIFKHHVNILAPVIVLSLSAGKVTTALKQAHITPILKKIQLGPRCLKKLSSGI